MCSQIITQTFSIILIFPLHIWTFKIEKCLSDVGFNLIFHNFYCQNYSDIRFQDGEETLSGVFAFNKLQITIVRRLEIAHYYANILEIYEICTLNTYVKYKYRLALHNY